MGEKGERGAFYFFLNSPALSGLSRGMPRTTRASAAEYCHHVLKRGNDRAEVFHKPADYEAFVAMIASAESPLPIRVLGCCLIPNHFHLVPRSFQGVPVPRRRALADRAPVHGAQRATRGAGGTSRGLALRVAAVPDDPARAGGVGANARDG